MVVKAPFANLSSSPRKLNHQPPTFYTRPKLEALTGGPVPGTAARKEAKGHLLRPCSNPHLIPT